MASHRRPAPEGTCRSTCCSLDQASPFLHLHADDTTVHASTPADAQAGSIALHVDATGARLQRIRRHPQGVALLEGWSMRA